MTKQKTLADRPRGHTRVDTRNPHAFFRATLETRNFSFEAFGADHDSAWGALVQGLNRHGRQYELPVIWYNDMISDIEVNEIAMGGFYRDGQEL